MLTQNNGGKKGSPFTLPEQPTEADYQIDWGTIDAFGELALFDSDEVPEIAAKDLPGWLAEYTGALSEYTQTPPAMAVTLSLSTVAACVQKRYEISPDGIHKEPLSFWGVVALPPASRKSAVLSALTAPIGTWERKQAILLAPKKAEIETQIDISLRRIEHLSKEAAKSKTDPKSQLSEISRLKIEMPKPFLDPQISVSDTTSEGLRKLLVEQNGRIAVISDEGCIFEIMAGLYSDSGAANIDVFLQGHSGGACRVKRANQSAVDLENIAVSFGLAIQPEIISGLSSGNKRGFRGKGLLARFFFVVPRSNIGTRVMGAQHPIPADVQQRYSDEIQSLLDIPIQRDLEGKEQARTLVLSKEAQQCWLQFSQWIENQQGEGGCFESIQDFTGKLAGQVLRIAGLMHVAQHHRQAIATVEKSTIDCAIALGKKLLGHAHVAFNSMGLDPAIADAKWTLDFILQNYEIEKSSFQHSARYIRQNAVNTTNRFKNTGVKRAINALEILRERGILSPQQKRVLTKEPDTFDLASQSDTPSEQKKKSGRKTMIWYINPALFAKGNSKAEQLKDAW